LFITTCIEKQCTQPSAFKVFHLQFIKLLLIIHGLGGNELKRFKACQLIKSKIQLCGQMVGAFACETGGPSFILSWVIPKNFNSFLAL